MSNMRSQSCSEATPQSCYLRPAPQTFLRPFSSLLTGSRRQTYLRLQGGQRRQHIAATNLCHLPYDPRESSSAGPRRASFLHSFVHSCLRASTALRPSNAYFLKTCDREAGAEIFRPSSRASPNFTMAIYAIRNECARQIHRVLCSYVLCYLLVLG